jgi:hypothetical protein
VTGNVFTYADNSNGGARHSAQYHSDPQRAFRHAPHGAVPHNRFFGVMFGAEEFCIERQPRTPLPIAYITKPEQTLYF